MEHSNSKRLGAPLPDEYLYETTVDVDRMRHVGVTDLSSDKPQYYRFKEGETLEWRLYPGQSERIGVIVYPNKKEIVLLDWIAKQDAAAVDATRADTSERIKKV